MKEMKIAFIMTKLGGPGWGGAHKVTVLIANYLSMKQHDVTIVVSEDSAQDFPVNSSIKIVNITNTYKKNKLRFLNLFSKLYYFRKYCAENKIDIVVGLTSNMAVYSVFSCIFSSRKSLISERTDPHFEPSKAILRFFRNCIYMLADRVVFQTPGARDYYPKSVRNRSVIIPNPINSNLPEPFEGNRELRVVNFCRIAKQKNIKVLLDAFEIFHKNNHLYRLEIYGDTKDPAYKNYLEEYVNTLSSKNSISFMGACTNIHDKVLSAKMFVSSSDYEGLSNSMLEAMSIGLPVIVTDCINGGERMCIENYVNGIIVPTKDACATALAMEEIASSPVLECKLSTNSRKIRTELSEDNILSKWLKLICEMHE